MIRLPGLRETTFSSTTVNLDVSGSRIYNGATVSSMELLSGTVTPNVRVVLMIPAGKVTATLALPSAWNVSASSSSFVFSPSLDTFIEVQSLMIGGQTWVFGQLTQAQVPDLDGPHVLSAVAFGSQLTVTWSEPVSVLSTTGMSLGFTQGTARSILGLASGDGTAITVFTLSGVTIPGDAATLSVAGINGVRDLAGNQADSTTVSVAFSSLPTSGLRIYYSATLQTQEGVPTATRITDFSGGGNHGSGPSVTIVSGSRFQMDLDPDVIGTSISCGTGAYTSAQRIRKPGTSPTGTRWLLCCSGNNLAVGINSSGFLYIRHNLANAQTYTTTYDTDSWGTEEHLVVAVYDGAGNAAVYVDNMTTPVGTFTGVIAPTNGIIQWGRFASAANSGFNGEVSAIAFYNVALDSAQRSAMASGLL